MLTRTQFDSLLRSWRTHSTLEAIGRQLGVTRQAVYEWQRGNAVPSDTVLLLAERLMKDKRGKLYERAGRETS